MKGAPRCSIIVAALVTLTGGCAINTTVDPVSIGDDQISDLCIKSNPNVLMEGFLPELESQIKSHGITTHVFSGIPPTSCKYHLEYTANWRWDLAMYLSYAELRVYSNAGLVGQAEYDARYGGGRMDKFGPTANKLETLTRPLFGRM